MSENKERNVTSSADIAAFTKHMEKADEERVPLTQGERKDEFLPKPLVKIVNYETGDVIQASLAQLNEQIRGFHKVILLIEDQAHASDACTKALHDLGYNGVQLITSLMEAEQHLEDIVSHLTETPAAIVLDLGLGVDSGFAVLRKCHSEPRLQQIPILVWTKHTDDLARIFSEYLGAQDFLVKSRDEQELSDALKGLMSPIAA
jgi:CheY-like chemotaxis protein